MATQSLMFDPAPPNASTATMGFVAGVPVYRYDLHRTWGVTPYGVVNFVMLNPSTADANDDDPTIRRCLDYARRWGFGGLVVTNLYSLRAPDPRELWKAPAPIGPDNDGVVEFHARHSQFVVCAWGNHGAARGRGRIVLDRLVSLGVRPHALRVTKEGQPSHPLYLPASLYPAPYGATP